jgi:hypothetical protein
MIVRLSHSGHYPDKYVEITDGEYQRIRKLERRGNLWDTPEGRGLIRDLLGRPPALTVPTVVVYA